MKESKRAALLLQDLPCFSFNPSSMFSIKKKAQRGYLPLPPPPPPLLCAPSQEGSKVTDAA